MLGILSYLLQRKISYRLFTNKLYLRLKDSNHPENDPEEVANLIDTIKDTLAKATLKDWME